MAGCRRIEEAAVAVASDLCGLYYTVLSPLKLDWHCRKKRENVDTQIL